MSQTEPTLIELKADNRKLQAKFNELEAQLADANERADANLSEWIYASDQAAYLPQLRKEFDQLEQDLEFLIGYVARTLGDWQNHDDDVVGIRLRSMAGNLLGHSARLDDIHRRMKERRELAKLRDPRKAAECSTDPTKSEKSGSN